MPNRNALIRSRLDTVPTADDFPYTLTSGPSLTTSQLLDNLSIGMGYGATNQLKGTWDMVAHPINALNGIWSLAKQAVTQPNKLAAALMAYGKQGVTSGPLEFGRFVGENLSLRRPGGAPMKRDIDASKWRRTDDGGFRATGLELDDAVGAQRDAGLGWANFDKDGNLKASGKDWITRPSAAAIKKAQEEAQQLAALWQGGTRPAPYFFRFGDLPKGGRSKNYISGAMEKGVSVYEAVPDVLGRYQFNDQIDFPANMAMLFDRPAYVVAGTRIGTGYDGEPLLSGAKVVRKLDRDEIKALLAPTK